MLHNDARYRDKSRLVGGYGIVGEFVTVTLEKMGESEDVRFNVPDESII